MLVKALAKQNAYCAAFILESWIAGTATEHPHGMEKRDREEIAVPRHSMLPGYFAVFTAVLAPLDIGCSGEAEPISVPGVGAAAGGASALGSGGIDSGSGSVGTGGGTPIGSGGNGSGGGGTGGGGTGGEGPIVQTGGNSGESIEVRAMSYNVYGYATMPQEAPTYAEKINSLDIDVLGIQEGVNDWKVPSPPTDYSRSEALEAALNANENCWVRNYQVFVNTCRGNSLVSHERFDLSDGPNAVRTGELAIIAKSGKSYAFIDVHWDHEDAAARGNNAAETAATANAQTLPLIVVGDLNTSCTGADASSMRDSAGLSLVFGSGIDCVFARQLTGEGKQLDGSPSDHPALVATFGF